MLLLNGLFTLYYFEYTSAVLGLWRASTSSDGESAHPSMHAERSAIVSVEPGFNGQQ